MVWDAVGLLCLVFGLLFTAGSIALWSGHSQQMRLQIVDFYIDQGLAGRMRRAYFAYPFFAVACLAGGVLAMARDELPPVAIAVCVSLLCAGFLLAFAVDRWAPGWAKPGWFQAEEAAGFPIRESREAARGERMTLLNWAAVACCALCVLLALFVLSNAHRIWVGPLFVVGGSAAGIAGLARHRRLYGPRRNR